MKRQESFTLVELLAVIAIITLLMAILLPTLNRARRQAQTTICRSNHRQIGLAAYIYTDSWNYYLPRGTGSADKTWFELFMSYLSHKPTDNDYRSVRIYRCPAYPDKEQTVCFVNNAWEFNSPDDFTGHPIDEPARILGLRHLDETIYLTDNEYGPGREIIKQKGDPGWHTCDVWIADHLPKESNLQRRVARTRHSKGEDNPGCNVLYLDWHSDWILIDDMTVDMWRFCK